MVAWYKSNNFFLIIASRGSQCSKLLGNHVTSTLLPSSLLLCGEYIRVFGYRYEDSLELTLDFIRREITDLRQRSFFSEPLPRTV